MRLNIGNKNEKRDIMHNYDDCCNQDVIRNEYNKLVRLLIERKLTITTMESATGGQIASLITDTEGSSAVIKGAFVTYCNEAKIMQGVPSEVIDKYSVYSEETVLEMAIAVRKKYSADISIGVSGTTGNIDPLNVEASTPGKVYFAIDYLGEIKSFKVNVPPQKSRYLYKMEIAHRIYLEIIKIIK